MKICPLCVFIFSHHLSLKTTSLYFFYVHAIVEVWHWLQITVQASLFFSHLFPPLLSVFWCWVGLIMSDLLSSLSVSAVPGQGSSGGSLGWGGGKAEGNKSAESPSHTTGKQVKSPPPHITLTVLIFKGHLELFLDKCEHFQKVSWNFACKLLKIYGFVVFAVFYNLVFIKLLLNVVFQEYHAAVFVLYIYCI